MTVHFQDIPDSVGASLTSDRRGLAKQSGAYGTFGKRFIELVLVLVTLPIWATIIAGIALVAARDGHSPFYRQERVGKDGRIFRMWKLRSMVPDADQLLAEHLASNSEARVEWETTQKLKNDPRITTFGRLIRRSSLDELPQLFNVLIGDMSLVGPRPMMVSQTSMYPGSAYFLLRPGMTGFWQISDRNECEFKDRAGFDTKYFREMSLWTDVSIMARTIHVVFRCTGY